MGAVATGAVIWPQVARGNARLAGWLSALVPAALAVWLIARVPDVGAGQLPAASFAWVPALGLTLDFRLDGVGLLLSVLVASIGALILIYGGGYLKGSPQAAPFFGFIHLFMLAMLGLAGADHLLVLFVFWELTSLASYLLIGLAHDSADARKAALRALLITGFGGVAMLAGFILLADAAGTWKISELAARADAVRAHPAAHWMLALILLGAVTKSAQVPFHFWLPGAMVAPTPVSAYLHSATMVKAGVYLLAKLSPVFSAWPAWSAVLLPLGALTMLAGAIFALAQTDLKRLLAYSTMSALGTLVVLLGIGTDLAVQAAMVFLIVHALYKAALFMVAGVVDKATGTRDITVLHGLGKQLPLLAFAAGLAAFSMSGVPPFIGFIGKELLYEAKVQAQTAGPLIIFCGFAANAINVAVALKVGFSPFVNRGEIPQINPKAKQSALLAGPLLLAIAGAVVGLWPDLIGKNLIRVAVEDITVTPTTVKLKLWHGFNLVLLLSGLTVAAGIALYAWRSRVRGIVAGALDRMPTRAAKTFDAGLSRVIKGAGGATRFFQHGNLRGYFAVLLLTVAALVFHAARAGGFSVPGFEVSNLRFAPVGVMMMMVVATVLAVRAKARVTALLALGGVGYGVALLYALYGAPDLALTQVLVETLTLVLFAFILAKLPPMRSRSSPRRRALDALIAGAAGLAVAVALLAARAEPAGARVSDAMVADSYLVAKGKNVVNVILVDFRALDTLGEISVLAIAALGVAALLYNGSPTRGPGSQATATAMYRASIRWLVPLLYALSILLLLRGHNEPGGGFIGGLVAASAAILRELGRTDGANGPRSPVLPVACGLAIALASAFPAWFHGQPWMQGVWLTWEPWLPLVGTTKLGTPFLFDIGVYAVVFGVARWILDLLLRGEPKTTVATADPD
jgi:multicomponent Na+:H+ antiporter subunit A